jgi:site-specific DNA-cytosine methylase
MTRCLSNFDQISIFDIGKAPLKIDKPVRLIELFAGIGSQAKALERIGVDFDKAAQHNSNAQLYKQAGNSIVVDVLVAIFKNMF